MKFTNPLFDTDITKYMAQFKVPTVDVDALMAAQRKNFEAIAAANQCALEGVGALVRRQGEIVRESVESYAAAVKDLLAEGSVEEKAGKQAELTKKSYDRAVANARELSDMLAKTGNEAFGVINDRIREGMTEVQNLVANGAAQTQAATQHNTAVAGAAVESAAAKTGVARPAK